MVGWHQASSRIRAKVMEIPASTPPMVLPRFRRAAYSSGDRSAWLAKGWQARRIRPRMPAAKNQIRKE